MISVPVNVKVAEISLVVHRADGSIEDLGVVSYWHRNPIKRFASRVRQLYKRISST